MANGRTTAPASARRAVASIDADLAPAADDQRARRPTPASRSLPLGEAKAPPRTSETTERRPEQARRRPGLGRSHLGESERRESDAVSWPVPVDTGRTAALLLARCETNVVYGAETCVRVGGCTRSQRGRRDSVCPKAATDGCNIGRAVLTAPHHEGQRADRVGACSVSPRQRSRARVQTVL
jgi:hypothetical protein